MNRRFNVRHRLDDWFWFGFLALGLGAIYFGFSDPVIRRFSGTAAYPAPLSLQVHVWSVSAWIVLVLMQVTLIRIRRLAFHRLLGWTLVGLVPIILVSGLWAEIISERFYETRFPDYVRFFHVPLAQMGGFGVFAALAFHSRRRPASHKRYIFLATSSLLGAAFGRAWGEYIDGAAADWSPLWRDFVGYHFGFMVLAALAIAYDLYTRRRVHPVLLIGIPLALAIMLAMTAASLSDVWPTAVRRLLGIS